jgi:hypothetical protein
VDGELLGGHCWFTLAHKTHEQKEREREKRDHAIQTMRSPCMIVYILVSFPCNKTKEHYYGYSIVARVRETGKRARERGPLSTST